MTDTDAIPALANPSARAAPTNPQNITSGEIRPIGSRNRKRGGAFLRRSHGQEGAIATENASDGRFARKVALALALAAAAFLLWTLRRIELLLFAAIVLSVMFDAAARGLTRLLPIGRGWALALAGILFVGLLTGAFSFFGFRFEAQIAQLIHSLPPAWEHFRQTLGRSPLGAELVRPLDQLSFSPNAAFFTHLKGYAVSTGSAIAAILLMLVGGLYLAAQPDTYRRGLLRLVPPGHRPRVETFLATCRLQLGRWLLVQASAMAVIGLLTGVGLWIIGVPAAGALGLLAGLLEFVPLIGVLLASAPALLLALTQGWTTTAWTLGLLVVVHQFEGNILQPLLQRGLVSIPPVITLFALVAFGEIFGLGGVMFATPLAIVCVAAVQVFYPQPDVEGGPPPRPLRLPWARKAKAS